MTMSTDLATRNGTGTVLPEDIERVLVQGDLSKLTPEQCVTYYHKVCESLGLNPLTKPFEYLMLNGKKVLYATRTAADQLRKINGVSVQVIDRQRSDDVYIVTARATLPNGRADEEIGAVNIANLKGEALANAYMKATTKAKRRVTLSICGLGWLDETEVDTIPGAQRVEMPALPRGVAEGEAASVTDIADSEPPAVDAETLALIRDLDSCDDDAALLELIEEATALARQIREQDKALLRIAVSNARRRMQAGA